MKVHVFLVLFIAEFCVSCDGYEKVPISTKETIRLDSIFKVGQIKGEKWAGSPRDFCMSQFPSITTEGTRYKLYEESSGRNWTTITVKEEGAFDDEVLGVQHKLTFELKDGFWRVTSHEVLLKRRE